jgi:hypothetical protein
MAGWTPTNDVGITMSAEAHRHVPRDPDDPRQQRHRRPRWVSVVLIVGAGLVAAALIAVLAGGDHGPGRHARKAASHASTGAPTQPTDRAVDGPGAS